MAPQQLGVTVTRSVGVTLLAGLLFTVEAVLSLAMPAAASVVACHGGVLRANGGANDIPDLVIDGPCTLETFNPNVDPRLSQTWKYGVVNIIAGGTLHVPQNVQADFWAKAILIQNKGSFTAGEIDSITGHITPFGIIPGSRLTIHLYGAEQSSREHGTGVPCKKKVGEEQYVNDPQCGIDDDVWKTNLNNPQPCNKRILPGPVEDCFYAYDPLQYDDGDTTSYFGYKVLGVSYGGTLRLYGFQGALYPDDGPVDPQNSGTSWLRLNNCGRSKRREEAFCQDGVLLANANDLLLDTSKLPIGGLNWRPGGFAVVTSTDYLSSHSEVRQILEVSPADSTVKLARVLSFPHNASVYDLTGKVPQDRKLTDLKAVDTRAAVALLTRSIQIVSGGAAVGEDLPRANNTNTDRYFGGHVVIRQGFQEVKLQGVEFYQLGQGGKIQHYPLHFHMARKVPKGTFVKDCSVWDSMTRAYVLHATQGVLLARNVGYRSIGHQYYLEDGTETDNQLYANLGISALAAVENAANNRKVPGILAYKGFFDDSTKEDKEKHADLAPSVPYKTDVNHPTLFWSLNGWNDFEYNMAVGAETCGLCYWMVAGNNSGGSKMMDWTGYASEQKDFDHDGNTPIQKFVGNTCSTAMTSFSSIADISPCLGTFIGDVRLEPIPNALLPVPSGNRGNETFYPVVHGGVRKGTFCPDVDKDCSRVNTCSDDPQNIKNCAVTTLDKYTTSFNFPEHNFAAIWLRPQWSLLIDSAVTDVLNGGVSFVTGGGYTRSDTPRGLWLLARKDVFIGNAQPFAANPYASNGGPVNPRTGLDCKNKNINYCIPSDGGHDQGPIFPRSNFAMNQRFFSIYDGPSLQDSNAYLDITTTPLTDCKQSNEAGGPNKLCEDSEWMQGEILGVPGVFQKDLVRPKTCYLPNAAIAWKQPNGFYYPPAFHSTNLLFNNVDVRHYVIEPLFLPGSLLPDEKALKSHYCNFEPTMLAGFTAVDRQTELSDDDGSLTGFVNTISVNQDPFFTAPTEDIECRSDIAANTDGTAKTSPYEHVTTVLYPKDCTTRSLNTPSADEPTCDGKELTWGVKCTNEHCFGVPLVREYLTPTEQRDNLPSILMSGQGIGQRSQLTVNHGRYFIDTTTSRDEQLKRISLNPPNQRQLSVFEKGKTYHVFLLFAKETTKQKYDIFVGEMADTNTVLNNVQAERTKIPTGEIPFETVDWPSTWKKTYHPSTGLLTVTIDMNFKTFTDDYTQSKPGRCQPESMCIWDTGSSQCKCNAKSQSYLPDDCTAEETGICKWAVSDIDYPDGGAYGFQFTLPDQFTYDLNVTLPKVKCLTKADNKGFDVPFKAAMSAVAGDCFTNDPPSPKFCTQP